MGSGVEATAHLAEVEFRSQGQYRTRIRRTNRSLSAILAAHDFVPHSCAAPAVYSCAPLRCENSVDSCTRIAEHEGRRVKHRGWGGGEELG